MKLENAVIAKAIPQPRAMPTMPPIIVSATASARNCEVRSERVAPSALRRPISRMRSVTVVSIMFMIPMPPTTSEMPAIEPSSSVSVLVTVDSVEARSAWFMILEVGVGRSR